MTAALPKAVRTADSYILSLLLTRIQELGGVDHLREQVSTPVPPAKEVDFSGLDEAAQEQKVKENIGLHLRQFMAGTDDSLSRNEAQLIASLFGLGIVDGDPAFPIGARATFPFEDLGTPRQVKGFVMGIRGKDPLLLVVDDAGDVATVQVAADSVEVTADQYVPAPPPAGAR